jgi:cell division septal protein FtsQ
MRLNIKNWLKKLRGTRKSPYIKSKGGVDAGRSAFVRLDEREKKQKRTLLKKLNLYWSSKKEQEQTYQSQPKPGPWRKVVLIGFLAGALMLFFQSGGLTLVGRLVGDIDYFRITSIQVQGCVNSAVDLVRSSSGIQVSTSILSVDPVAVATAVKNKNPWVKDVSVSRQWPDTLVLRIDEYEPYALMAISAEDNAKLHYIDRIGTPFVKTSYMMDLDYPVITGLEEQVDEIRRSEQLQQPLHLLRLLGANNPNLPVQSISEVHVDDEDGLVVYLVEHPFPIFFGQGEVREKYVRLRKVLEMLYRPRRTGMEIGRVAYIRMDYLEDKVIVGYSESG